MKTTDTSRRDRSATTMASVEMTALPRHRGVRGISPSLREWCVWPRTAHLSQTHERNSHLHRDDRRWQVMVISSQG